MKKIFFNTALIFSTAFLFTSCLTIHVSTQKNENGEVVKTETKTKKVQQEDLNRREYSLQALMWQQNAGEYIALCHQAYHLARFRLDEQLATQTAAVAAADGLPFAIITDIDETVMDNSPFQAEIFYKNEDYTLEEWKNWTGMAKAKAVPGAVEFLNYVKSQNVEVFYVSNRTVEELEPTLKNMDILGLPNADPEYVLLMENTSSKKERFDQVHSNYNVLLYMGDNLGDFTSKFRLPSTRERNALVNELKEDFGRKFIVFPNPMYGDWETRGIYKGKHDWTDEQIEELRKSSIRAY